jgi:DNA-binding winged helix-turn-helix (wHTH) protein/TolB-like protein/cytochrome c-type biogenesis protein CcmH/NrfG
MDAVPADNRLRVGDWTVEPDLNQLSTQGRAVKVEPKTMAVLLHLANRPGQVVDRETLLSQVWPGVVVGDDSLTQVVIKLRKALGDDPDRPTYIQTVTKRGYRLVAPVLRPAGTATPPRRPHRIRWFAGAAALALLIATGLWWSTGQQARRVSPGPDLVVDVTQPPTLAIAPFEALSKDSQELLLARGITADLLTDLSKSSGLSVIGFSPMEGRPRNEGSSHARYLVSGTVQRIDERLRLHVFLTERATGRQLWSERFDRSLTDLFAIQDELGPKIVRMLPAKVSEAELRRMAQRHTRNLQAYEHFQQGQAALLLRQKSGNETARQMFRRAIDLDKSFARAYSGLALTYAADYRNQWTADAARALGRAFELARTANEINPDIPETYWTLAYVHAQRREHQQALQHLERSLTLYPSFADGYALMASVKTFAGQPAASIPLMRTAMRLNPTSGYLYFLVLGRAYFFLGNLEQARINLEEASKRNPEYLETHIYLAAVEVAGGDTPSAGWEADQIRFLEPAFSARHWLDNYPMTDNGQKTKLLRALDPLGL